MNLLDTKLNRLYLFLSLFLTTPGTFFWYSLDDYSSPIDAFNLITSSTGLSWLIICYLTLFFACFTRNLELRSFLSVFSFVSHLYFLVWITDIWRANQVPFFTLLKNVFVKSNSTPFVELLGLISLIFLFLAIFIQKTRIANFLTALLNYSKVAENKFVRLFFYVFSAAILLISTLVLCNDLINTFNAAKVETGSGLKSTLIWLLVLGVFSIALQLLITCLILITLLWAWVTWQEDFKTILSHIRDFKLNEYLTRKVAGYLYTLYFVVIVGVLAVAVPIWSTTDYGMNGQIIIFPIALLVGVAVGFILLVTLRLIAEISVAVIHIAENTK
jgi:hypothetical protein